MANPDIGGYLPETNYDLYGAGFFEDPRKSKRLEGYQSVAQAMDVTGMSVDDFSAQYPPAPQEYPNATTTITPNPSFVPNPQAEPGGGYNMNNGISGDQSALATNTGQGAVVAPNVSTGTQRIGDTGLDIGGMDTFGSLSSAGWQPGTTDIPRLEGMSLTLKQKAAELEKDRKSKSGIYGTPVRGGIYEDKQVFEGDTLHPGQSVAMNNRTPNIEQQSMQAMSIEDARTKSEANPFGVGTPDEMLAKTGQTFLPMGAFPLTTGPAAGGAAWSSVADALGWTFDGAKWVGKGLMWKGTGEEKVETPKVAPGMMDSSTDIGISYDDEGNRVGPAQDVLDETAAPHAPPFDTTALGDSLLSMQQAMRGDLATPGGRAQMFNAAAKPIAIPEGYKWATGVGGRKELVRDTELFTEDRAERREDAQGNQVGRMYAAIQPPEVLAQLAQALELKDISMAALESAAINDPALQAELERTRVSQEMQESQTAAEERMQTERIQSEKQMLGTREMGITGRQTEALMREQEMQTERLQTQEDMQQAGFSEAEIEREFQERTRVAVQEATQANMTIQNQHETAIQTILGNTELDIAKEITTRGKAVANIQATATTSAASINAGGSLAVAKEAGEQAIALAEARASGQLDLMTKEIQGQLSVVGAQISRDEALAMAENQLKRDLNAQAFTSLKFELEQQALAQGRQISSDTINAEAQRALDDRIAQLQSDEAIAITQARIRAEAAGQQRQITAEQARQQADIELQTNIQMLRSQQELGRLQTEIKAQADMQGRSISSEEAMAEAQRFLQTQLQQTTGQQQLQQIAATGEEERTTMRLQQEMEAQEREALAITAGQQQVQQARQVGVRYTGNLSSALSHAASSGDYVQAEQALSQMLPPTPPGISWDTATGTFQQREGFQGREMDFATQQFIAAVTPAFKARDRGEIAVREGRRLQQESQIRQMEKQQADEDFRQAMLTDDIDSAEEALARQKMAETSQIENATKLENLQMMLGLIQNPVQLGMAKRHGLLGQIETVLGFKMSNVPESPQGGAAVPNVNDWAVMDNEEKSFRLASFVEGGGSPEEFMQMVGGTAPAQMQQVQYGVL